MSVLQRSAVVNKVCNIKSQIAAMFRSRKLDPMKMDSTHVGPDLIDISKVTLEEVDTLLK